MASASPHSPITVETKLPMPLNGSLYSTTRDIAREKPTPQIGATMEGELGPAWASSRIVGVNKSPTAPQSQLQITHAKIPTVAEQLISNWEWSSVDLGGKRFEGITRTSVYLTSEFDEESPVAGAAMEIGADNRFLNDGYILVGRDVVSSGMQLEPVFRVDRRSYIQRTTMGNVVLDLRSGRSKRSITTLHYRGEIVDGTAIETLAAAPGNAYWGLQSDGVFRELEQLSTDWFAVTESTSLPADAVNSLANPAKTRVTERVTPTGTDLVFYETGAMPSPIPAYGSAHYDTVNFPDHVLAFIEPADEIGLLFRFHYVKVRDAEDPFNWTHSQADLGGTKFPTVSREYVVLRASYNPDSPAQGAAMPDVPASLFAGAYVLSERKQSRTNDPKIDNLFVIERLSYVLKSTHRDLGYDQETGRARLSTETLYYRGETISGTAIETLVAAPTNAYWGLQANGIFRESKQLSTNWFSVTERNVLPEGAENSLANPAKTRQVNRVTPLGTDVIFTETGSMPVVEPAYGSAHYDAANWPNHKLALIEAADQSGKLYKFTYVADRATQDLYNFEHTQADLGGNKFSAVKRTYIILRSAFSATSPAQGSVMPDSPVGLFAVTYVLAGKEQSRIGQPELDSLYVVEVRTYLKRCTITQLGVDALNGKALTATDVLWHESELPDGVLTAAALFAAPTNTYWGLQTDGTQRTGRQLSCTWYSISTEAVVGGVFAAGVVAVDSFTTNDPYYWPPVLDVVEFLDWLRLDGGTDIFPAYRFEPEGYNGPCATLVTRTWSKTPFTIPVVQQMLATGINYSCPFFRLNIPECLHPTIGAVCDIGSGDATYDVNAGSTRYFSATNFIAWPATITSYDDQAPFRGGFLRTTRVVTKPVVPTLVNWTTGL